MDFGKAFTFVFDDPDWLKKVAINALIGLIPLIGQLYVLGWGLEVARRVATGSATPLPDVDFGTFLGHGLKAFVVSLVYTAPIWILSIVVAIITAIGGQVSEDAGMMLTTITSICLGLFSLVFGLLLGVIMPAALTRTVVLGTIKDGLDVRAVWALVSNAVGPYLMTLVGTILASLLAAIVGSLACGIGLIFTMAYYQVVMGHFYGQAYREANAAV
jgi:hypothetical protein